MYAEINRLENAARMAMAHHPVLREGPKGAASWRLGVLVAALVAALAASAWLFLA